MTELKQNPFEFKLIFLCIQQYWNLFNIVLREIMTYNNQISMKN